jgi:hypothetical protein
MSARPISDLDWAAIEATRRLRSIQDIIDQVGRPDGEYLTISRQALDDLRDHAGVISRRVCDLAAGVRR